MAKRKFPDWISAYLTYASVTEAPKHMHFWSAVGTIAGALRRRVWIDMKRYTWYPSFYIVFVAKPGVVAKSTTIDISTDLLKRVPGIRFGPNVATMPALVGAFEAASESFEYAGAWYPMAALTLVASELGSLLNLQDKEMTNLLIELWDGKKFYEKITKTSGSNAIEGPWINMLAATTPHWVAESMPPAMIGGGLSSRCLFVYGESKERYIAYVDETVGKEDLELRDDLVADLEIISQLAGPYTITPAARAWGKAWYEHFWKTTVLSMNSQTLEGYAARKQTHMHKTAMVLSASRGGSLEISLDDLQLANTMLENLEGDMNRVFSRIGLTDESINAERFIEFVRKKGSIPYTEAYQMIHLYFPDFKDFEGILEGAIRSGQLSMQMAGTTMMLCTPVKKV